MSKVCTLNDGQTGIIYYITYIIIRTWHYNIIFTGLEARVDNRHERFHSDDSPAPYYLINYKMCTTIPLVRSKHFRVVSCLGRARILILVWSFPLYRRRDDDCCTISLLYYEIISTFATCTTPADIGLRPSRSKEKTTIVKYAILITNASWCRVWRAYCLVCDPHRPEVANLFRVYIECQIFAIKGLIIFHDVPKVCKH